jgi:hypothetical protein
MSSQDKLVQIVRGGFYNCMNFILTRAAAIDAAGEGTADYANLLACYRSGQVSEAQWQQHLSDPEFLKWLKEEGK